MSTVSSIREIVRSNVRQSGLVVALVAILLLGNIAMATYCLIQLFRVPASADLHEVLLRNGTA